MSDECKHIWCLDHEKYFDDGVEEYTTSFVGIVPVLAFPAKCEICHKSKKFTKKEWLDHLQAQGRCQVEVHERYSHFPPNCS